MHLIVFNVSHDEALAANEAYYTPTLAAQHTEAQLVRACRPHLAPDEQVLVDSEPVEWEKVSDIQVWGWDLHVRQRLRRLGCPECLLPSDAYLARLRRLSSRQTAVALLPRLRSDVKETFGESVFLTTFEATEAYCLSTPRCVLKAPWSCSGRGLIFVDKALSVAQANRARKLLALQGGLVAEPFYAHEADFAFECTYTSGRLTLERINSFVTNAWGQYLRNDTSLPPVSPSVLDALFHSLSVHLPQLLTDGYNGPLGIDMMAAGGKVHPCVEINLRNTMGRWPDKW